MVKNKLQKATDKNKNQVQLEKTEDKVLNSVKFPIKDSEIGKQEIIHIHASYKKLIKIIADANKTTPNKVLNSLISEILEEKKEYIEECKQKIIDELMAP